MACYARRHAGQRAATAACAAAAVVVNGVGSVGSAIRDVPRRVLRAGFLWASRRRALGRAALSTAATRRLVDRFVAGDTLEEALADLERIHAEGFATTLDILGESVESTDEARAAADRYIEALGALASRGLDRNVSLKLTQMGLDLDPAFCRANLSRVLSRAAATGAFVRIDMEDHTRTDVTLGLAREMHGSFPDTGVVIQSYLRRSEADVERLIVDRIRVRLCKGAYNEPPTVAFASKQEVDDSYRRLMERLLVDGVYPAIATHDVRLIRHAIDFTNREGIDPSRFEFQMLYGVRRDLQQRLLRAGYTVRVYVPYGSEWYPYFTRRLAERPANVLFVVTSILRERRSPERR